MKKVFGIFAAVMTVVSVSQITFAAADSEFERGYEAGKESCGLPSELWSCTVTFTSQNNIYTANSVAFSRAQTLHTLLTVNRLCSGSESCRQAVLDKKAICIAL